MTRARALPKPALILLALATLAYMGSGHRTRLDAPDEGAMLYAAERILHGEHPFRDFWINFMPGQCYVLAGALRLFGDTLRTARLLTVLENFAAVVAAYALAAVLSSRAAAAATWLACAVSLGFFMVYESQNAPALFCGLLACLAFERWLRRPGPGGLAAAGALAGLSALFRQDLGLYAAAALGLGALAARRRRARSLAGLACGFTAVALPAAALLLAFGRWQDVSLGLIEFPLSIYPRFFPLPYPPLRAGVIEFFPFYLPFIVYGGAALKLAFFSRGEDRDPLAISVLALGALFWAQASVRADIQHLQSTLVVALVLLPWLVLPRRKPAPPWRWALLALAAGLSAYPAARFKLDYARSTAARTDLVAFSLPRAQGLLYPRDAVQAYEQAVRETRDCAGPGGRIFSGLPRHDIAPANDPFFYYLAERASGTRYYFFAGGVTATSAIQERIVSDLEANRVDCLVLKDFSPSWEPNLSFVSSGVRTLDAYIAERFETYDAFPGFILKKRRHG
ncbi:MAG: glycosyltransferase family 39 protein [Elusimicrobia bacterium]|nr:glycosyltransferase family 39 protein [Elusimicrobiota bacterium]